MPLPENGSHFPPAGHSQHLTAMDEWSAWYSGDPDQLQAHYGAAAAVGPVRPSQRAGGVLGAVARWWWGQPSAEGEARTKLHVPLAADIAGTSADLLFSEPVSLTAKDTRLADFFGSLADDGLHAQLHEGGEVCAALGGVYLRTTWDAEVSERPWLDAIQPDGAFPEFRHGRLRAVNLWTQLPEVLGGVTHRLVERHESGAILYRLYAGTPSNVGHIVPLQDHPDTMDLADLVNEDGVQETLTKRLTVSYVPNMLPNRSNRRSHQGRSDFQGVTQFFDALDEAYSSWQRDIRHAKSRLHVPAQYLDSDGPGSAGIADVDREVYVPMEGVLAKADDGLMIQAQQFAIRHAEHAATCADWANRAVQSAGYAASTFGEQDGTAMTAAEVQQRERRSYMTRGKKVRYWTMGLRDALPTLVEVANAHLGAGVTLGDFGVDFGTGVQESQLALANTALALRNAEAASTETRVRMLHPGWDKTQVEAEVASILSESGGSAAVPFPGDAGL